MKHVANLLPILLLSAICLTGCKKTEPVAGGDAKTGSGRIEGSTFIDFPARQIRADNAAEFWKDKDEKLKAGEGDADFQDGRVSVAYVTNGIDPFWTVAAAGAKAAGRDFDVNVLLRFPPKGVGDQKSMLEALLVQDDVTGIAVSPIDPENQQEILNEIGDKKHYITQDSDAPNTNRMAYIGMDNYDAGRMAGELVKEAMPEGGSVMIFVGRLGQLNAEQRRQGVIDELLDRPRDSTRRDPPDGVLKGEKYTIVGTRTDNFDKAKAKQNAQDAISKYPELGCMVGLFAYNPPLCLQAIREAGREVRPGAKETTESDSTGGDENGQASPIYVVGFDEHDETLQAIVDGEIHGTVVQNPYMYGYKSVEILKRLADDEVVDTGDEAAAE